MEIRIDPEFASLLPPLLPEERAELEQLLVLEGRARDPVVTWQGVIVDGHHRYALCQEHGLPFDVVEKDFANRGEAKEWARRNQRGRRNDNAFRRIEAALAREHDYKVEAKERQRGGQGGKLLLPTVGKSNTQERIAQEARVSKGQVDKVKKILAAGDAELIRQARAGDVSVDRAYQTLQAPHVARNTGEQEWYTPPEYLQAARAVLGGIDLDPASSDQAQRTVRAAAYYTRQDDGLARPWTGRVFLNPPYTAGLVDQFVAKLLEHHTRGDVPEAIVLVNNATDTQWFQSLAARATAICFPAGRVRFLDQDGRAGAPLQGQAVLFLGVDPGRAAGGFGHFGFITQIRS